MSILFKRLIFFMRFVGTWLHSKSNYLELRWYIKNRVGCVIDGYRRRNHGKSTALILLSNKYNLPIIISNHDSKLDLYLQLINNLHCSCSLKKKINFKTIAIHELINRKEKLDIVLVDDCLDDKLREIVYQKANIVIGYK